MARNIDATESDTFLNIAVHEYKNVRGTPAWDEQYKWDILTELNNTLSLQDINTENVLQQVEILQQRNPSRGSFVHWSDLDGLHKAAQKHPEEVVKFFHVLTDETKSLAARIDEARETLKPLVDSNFGTPFMGYLLAAHDRHRYPLYKDEIFRHFYDALDLEWGFGNEIGSKYAAYVELCEQLATHLQNKEVIDSADVMDGQDLLYTIARIEPLRYKIYVRHLSDFAQRLKKYENDTNEFLRVISQMDRKYLDDMERKYRGSDKINNIRHQVLKKILARQPLTTHNLQSLMEKENAKYHENILVSWNEFRILFQIYFNYYKNQINYLLSALHAFLRTHKAFADTQFEEKKTVNDFSWNQNFGTTSCWIALYPATKNSHKDAAQLFFGIYDDGLKYGLRIGDNLSSDKYNNDLNSVPNAESFQLGALLQKFESVYPAFKEINAVSHRYWKIAPGENAWNWEACRDGGYIAIGWDKTGDLSSINREEFDERRDSLVASVEDYTTEGMEQLWKFAKEIKPGDYIVANQGTTRVLGIGQVAGNYYFVDNTPHGHRYPVEWIDTTSKEVNEPGWRRTLIELNEQQFEEIARRQLAEPFANIFRNRQDAELAFDLLEKTFNVLGITQQDDDRFAVTITKNKQILRLNYGNWAVLHFYNKGKNDYRVGMALRDETDPDLILKQWDFFADSDARLTELPFSVLPLNEELWEIFEQSLNYIAERFTDWKSSPYRKYNQPEIVEAIFDKNKRPELLTLGMKNQQSLYPGDDGEATTSIPYTNPKYPLTECSQNTGIPTSLLKKYIRAIERKKQAILYGPPGTSKTFLAQHLARHLIGGQDGFMDIIQFHPAYAYEDFIQGLRPQKIKNGQLEYNLVAGRFLDFVNKAQQREGICVLIIDEINRANLSRVFGELMYLLEYRNENIPLAAGATLSIPDNVRIIGTMNTADRSIALVDHALRRRFAFIALYPNYDIIVDYHNKHSTGFQVSRLINLLKRLNTQIADRHYEIGQTFFLRENLEDELEDIWHMEIEPYLEEYFFDQPDKVESFRWEKIKQEIFPELE
ncbi:MAG: AAA family ATPase [Thermoplasmatota archaeon]